MSTNKKTYNTACPRNCYSTCSFLVTVEDGKVSEINPQPLNKATPEGICLKGLSYIERTNSPKRIIKPLKKVNGNFIEISMDEALKEISEKLLSIREKYSPQSVMFYSASGMSGLLNSFSSNFWKMFGGATTVYGNLCWPAGLEAVRLTLGENKHNAPWDLENSDLIIVWGKNPAESNIQQMIPIEKAQSKGAKLIVIDPRRTPSSERANLLIQPKPGTDAFLALTIAKILIDRNHIDKSFIDKYVLGFDEFKNSLSEYSVEKCINVTGVKEEFIYHLADEIVKSEAMTIVPGYGMQRYSNGGQTIRSLLTLNILTGNIGKKGACFHYADLQGDIFSEVKEPLSYFPPKKTDGIFRREISTARLGEEMLNISDPELKAIWVERGNPVAQNPDSNKVKEAFRKLEYKIVVEQFLTDTALEADIILPAKSMFEQSDIISSYWNPYIQLKQKVVDPPGEVLPETEIYFRLAELMNFPEEEISKNLIQNDDAVINNWLEEQLTKFEGLSLDKLKEGPVLTPGYQEIAFEDLMFDTPSEKIELYSEEANKRWNVNKLPSFEKPVEFSDADEKYKFNLLSPNTKNRIHSQFGNLEVIKIIDPEPFATISAIDAESKKIKTGDMIKVFNDRGEITLKTKIDFSLRPGNIVVINGYWHQEGACPNSLSKGRETDMGFGTAFHDNLVNFEKVKR